MKRTKLVLGVAALSAALLGTGYAAMTDVLTIGGTVNTANFNVDFGARNDATLTVNKEADAAEVRSKYEIKDLSVNLNNEADKLEFAVSNLKVGVPIQYTTTMENKSSIQAVLEGIEVKTTKAGTLDLSENIHLTIQVGKQTAKGSLANFEQKIQNIVLAAANEQNDKTPLILTVELQGDPTVETLPTEGTEFDIKFNWKQTEGAITE